MLNVTPYPFQDAGVDYLLAHHYAILGDQMGLGKSLQGIYLSEKLRSKTLVVCPAYLKTTWLKEWRKLVARETSILLCSSKKNIPLVPDTDVVIINYEQVKYAGHLFKWAGLVIADEVHYLKNIKAQRTMAFHQYLQDHTPDRFVGLSGTPITNRVTEFYSLIALCSYNPKGTSGISYRKSFYSFANKFCNRINMRIAGRNIIKYDGVKNVTTLKELLKGKYLRRLAKNHLELPDMITKDIFVSYEENTEDLKKAWDEFNTSGVTAHSAAKALSAATKARFTADYCKGLLDSGEGPLLVYSDHIHPVDCIAEYLAEYRVAKVTGATDVNKRGEIVDQFQQGKLDLLVATIGSCSTGFTLTASRNIVFNDISWVGANNEQAKKRIHRIGQDKLCLVHMIIGSIVDEAIIKAVTQKEKIIGEVL